MVCLHEISVSVFCASILKGSEVKGLEKMESGSLKDLLLQ